MLYQGKEELPDIHREFADTGVEKAEESKWVSRRTVWAEYHYKQWSPSESERITAKKWV